MNRLFEHGGGYRSLDAFMMASLIDYATSEFCNRFLPYTEDAQGKQRAQMLGAARSARQNIIEGTERATTSRETEIRLLDVAKASMAELVGDFEMLLRRKNAMPWLKDSAEFQAVKSVPFSRHPIADDDLYAFRQAFDEHYAKFALWLSSPDAAIVANALAVMGLRAIAMLKALTEKKFADFLAEGGFKEKLTRDRIDARDANAQQLENVPECPLCHKPMVLRTVRKGEKAGNSFWGCRDYPECKGALNVE